MSKKERFKTLRIDKHLLRTESRNALQAHKYRYVTVRKAGMFRVEIGNGHVWPCDRTEIYYWHPLGGFVLRAKSEAVGSHVQMIRVMTTLGSTLADFLQFAAHTYREGLDKNSSGDNFIVNLNVLEPTERQLDGEIECYLNFEVENCAQSLESGVDVEDEPPF